MFGQTFSPNTNYEFVAHPDPNKFWVLADLYFGVNTTDTTIARQTKLVSLKRLKTVLSNAGSVIEKGEIKIAFFTNAKTSATEQCKYAIMLTYQDA